MSVNAAVIWAFLGAVVAATVQLYVPGTGDDRWWLNSGRGVYITLSALFVVAGCVGTTMPWPPWRRWHWLPPVLFWAGANTGLVVVLFMVGPGNLFPIVAGVGAVLTFLAVGGGALVGMGIRGLWELALRRPQ